jgi:hypothetical protein
MSESPASATVQAAPVDSFGIALPPDWVRFPLEGADFEAFVRLQRARLAESGQLSKTAQRQFELVMRQIRNDCERENVTLAALLAAPIDPDSPTGEVGPEPGDNLHLLSATCTLSTVTQGSLGTDLPLTVNTIAAAMGREPGADEDGVEAVNLEPPARIELAAGRAVKLVRLHTYPPHPETRQRLSVFAQHLFVPYDAGRRAAVITFSTPNVEYAKPLSGLFDEMAATFRMFGGDDPTDPLA